MNGRTVLLVNTNRIKPPIAPLALDYLGAALVSCPTNMLHKCRMGVSWALPFAARRRP